MGEQDRMGEMVSEGRYGKAGKHDLSECTEENELFLYGKFNTWYKFYKT